MNFSLMFLYSSLKLAGSSLRRNMMTTFFCQSIFAFIFDTFEDDLIVYLNKYFYNQIMSFVD